MYNNPEKQVNHTSSGSGNHALSVGCKHGVGDLKMSEHRAHLFAWCTQSADYLRFNRLTKSNKVLNNENEYITQQTARRTTRGKIGHDLCEKLRIGMHLPVIAGFSFCFFS
jgi:hypothetical protein